MAGIKLTPDDSELAQQRPPAAAAGDLISDDDRSIAADSWSIKSDYGSTLDDEQRHADATEALDAANLLPASDYSSDREEEERDGISSMLGLQSYWDSAYSNELANFREHGHAGEVWFGGDVMETVVSWTRSLCINISRNGMPNCVNDGSNEVSQPVGGEDNADLSSWSVLDIGTGNGLLLQEFAKHGFSNLTGTDYSEGAVNLARGLAERDGISNINFLVDDILETKLERQFSLVVDKGTLDAIGLHPDGPLKRTEIMKLNSSPTFQTLRQGDAAVMEIMYWDSVTKLVSPGGLVVITSCNSTKDELIQEVENYNRGRTRGSQNPENPAAQEGQRNTTGPWQYMDHVRSYPTFMFGGVVGSRVATVAFRRN